MRTMREMKRKEKKRRKKKICKETGLRFRKVGRGGKGGGGGGGGLRFVEKGRKRRIILGGKKAVHETLLLHR